MATITGGCLCGRVRYTVTGDPAPAGICHCRNCQRYTGSWFEAVMAFPPDAVNVQGEVKTYEIPESLDNRYIGASVQTADLV